MRLTEALHYYNVDEAPSDAWVRLHNSHFSPTPEDVKIRETWQKRLRNKRLGRKKKKMEIYE